MHGRQLRRTGRSRRRDDAQPVLAGRSPIRTPEGDIAEVVHDITSPMQRRKIWRLPVIRGVVALGESLAIGFRALAISANVASQERDENGEIQTQISRGQIIFSFAIAIGFALMLFKVGPALLTSWLPVESTEFFVIVEGADPRRRPHRLHPRHLAAARPAPRLPVPRRRAQGDQRARGGRRADAGQCAEVQPDPPALRNSFFALGDGDRDLRVRVRRSARLVLADREPDPAAPGDRRARVRAHPLRGQAPGQPRADDAARARALAPAPHDAPADGRPGRGLDPGAPARARARKLPRRPRSEGSSRASRSWRSAARSSARPRSTGRERRREDPVSCARRAPGRSSCPSTIASRVDVTEGKTSPEELLAAAHATCFVTSLGSELARAGTPPERMHVRCTITMDEVEGGRPPDRRLRISRPSASRRAPTPSPFAAAAETADARLPVLGAHPGQRDRHRRSNSRGRGS